MAALLGNAPTACAKPTPERAAAEADAAFGTHAFTWLATHEPSALVTWGVDPARLRAVDPSARVEPAGVRGQCARALARHAALFVVLPRGRKGEDRLAAALDCGFALYRDARALVIAPR